jgi:magnesium chelatase family protein
MHFAKVYSAQTSLLSANIVSIETDITKKTLHSFSIVGLPDKAVEESRDRVSAAVKNSGYKSPKSSNQKIIISLAPASIKKAGPTYDLGMAICYLKASEEIQFSEEGRIFIGELSLDGEIKSVRGILALVAEAKRKGFKDIFVPFGNREEAALIKGVNILPAKNLKEVISHLDEGSEENVLISPQEKTNIKYEKRSDTSFEDIRGQEAAKRGLVIAAAGGHNIILYGPPGTGKTMLARAFRDILPNLSYKDSLETTAIHSIAGRSDGGIISSPPFRAPHHSASHVSIVGGGTIPKPGEVTLSHRGVLFLDEFPEFERRVIDSLRQPLEERVVNISRASGNATFPADFILIAAMNPCPCGNFGSHRECTCLPSKREKYRKKISGPIIDRIDMWIEVPHINIELLSRKRKSGNGETIRSRNIILEARKIQLKRFKNVRPTLNSRMSVRNIESLVTLTKSAQTVLNQASKKLKLSPRSYHRIIKLARTIADLDNREYVEESHILEALQYRPKNNV